MRDAVEAGDVRALGTMLREAYESKKRMNPHIADGTPIERLLDLAKDAGALGGKVCGAGGGGYLLLACEPERRWTSARAALEAQGGQFAALLVPPARRRGPLGEDGRTWMPS